jgi:hypothetical protein
MKKDFNLVPRPGLYSLVELSIKTIDKIGF